MICVTVKEFLFVCRVILKLQVPYSCSLILTISFDGHLIGGKITIQLSLVYVEKRNLDTNVEAWRKLTDFLFFLFSYWSVMVTFVFSSVSYCANRIRVVQFFFLVEEIFFRLILFSKFVEDAWSDNHKWLILSMYSKLSVSKWFWNECAPINLPFKHLRLIGHCHRLFANIKVVNSK